jgi:hypothetical protein
MASKERPDMNDEKSSPLIVSNSYRAKMPDFEHSGTLRLHFICGTVLFVKINAKDDVIYYK